MSKEIRRSYIVQVRGKIKVLYCTTLEYFITTNGAFGQRDTYIEKIDKEDAWILLDTTNSKLAKRKKLTKKANQ